MTDVEKRRINKSYGTSGSSTRASSKKSADLLQAVIGDFGRWQLQISLLMSLLKFPIAWFQLGIVFLAPPTEFWCKPPAQFAYMSPEQWKIFSEVPVDKKKHHYSTLELGSCQMRDVESDMEMQVVPCLWGYDYNRSVIRSSIITEWDLVCEREKLVDLAQMVLMFGVLVGSIIFGVAADKFGRRRILVFCIFMQSSAGILSALSPWFYVFLLSRFLLATANGGTMITSFVMCMEIVGGRWRAIVPILYQIPFGIGSTMMAIVAYYLRDWRTFQFTLSAMSTFYFFYGCFTSESPRWLLAVGRKDEAFRILRRAARINAKLSSAEINRIIDEFEESSKMDRAGALPKSSNFLDLFKSAEVLKRTIVLCINWFLCGMSFFGFTQYLGQVSSNIYFAVALGGLIAVPGTFLCVVVVQQCGRRRSIACSSFFTGLCFLLILAVPRGVFEEDWPRVALAGLGVMGMSVSVPALYLFTGELFPTVLRNAGVGCSVMCSKLGSMLAPLVISIGSVVWFLPLLILGFLSGAEGLLVLLLPETLDKKLPDTVKDIEETDDSLDDKVLDDSKEVLFSPQDAEEMDNESFDDDDDDV